MTTRPETLIQEPSPLDQRNQRIVQLATQCLRQSGYRPLASISCEFHEGILTMRGEVPSYYLKQMAQVLARTIAEVEFVDNRLVVR